MEIGTTTMENRMEVPQKFKYMTYHVILQSHSWAYIPTKISLKKTHATHMFTAALFTTARTWKQPKCLLTDDWIRKMYIYTMKYYSAIKNNKIIPFAATWMELETLILSEVRKRKTNTI